MGRIRTARAMWSVSLGAIAAVLAFAPAASATVLFSKSGTIGDSFWSDSSGTASAYVDLKSFFPQYVCDYGLCAPKPLPTVDLRLTFTTNAPLTVADHMALAYQFQWFPDMDPWEWFGEVGFDAITVGPHSVTYAFRDESLVNSDATDVWIQWGNYAGVQTSSDFDGTPYTVRLETVGGVPEPAAWALTILGFAGVGAALRRGRGRAWAH